MIQPHSAQHNPRIAHTSILLMWCLWILFGVVGCPTNNSAEHTSQTSTHTESPAKPPALHKTAQNSHTNPNDAQHTNPTPKLPNTSTVSLSKTTDPTTPQNPKTFLSIGDSQLQGHFGRALDTLLRLASPKHRVTTHAVCSSTLMSWHARLKHRCGKMQRLEGFTATSPYGASNDGVTQGEVQTPTVLELLTLHTPDVLVITLGENEKKSGTPFIQKHTPKLMQHVMCYRAGIHDETTCNALSHQELQKRLLHQKRTLGCAWVMTPWTNKSLSSHFIAGRIHALQASIGGTCVAIDSRPLTCNAGYKGETQLCRPDRAGIHFSMRRARLWAFSVYERLNREFGVTPLNPKMRATLLRDWQLGID